MQAGPGARVILTFNAGPQTTWGEWADTVVALEEWTLRWNIVALHFALNMLGESGPPLGVGSLQSIFIPP